MNTKSIKGYDYGTPRSIASPFKLKDLDLLKKTVLFSEEDEKYLKLAGEVLEDQVEDVLDLWYGFVAGNEHLVYYFTGSDGKPIEQYLQDVRGRFGQWIKDLCNRKYDQDWLNYQYEIALRHHKTKKNQTDNVKSVPYIPFRYMSAFIYPITATIESFLSKKGHSAEEVEKMHQAWFKAVVLTVTLWCYPYVNSGEF